MRKVSRADETSEINYHNAGRPWGPPKVVQIQPAPASQETIDRQNRSVTFLPRDVEPDPRGVFDFDLGRYTNEPDPDEPADMGQAPVDWNAINQQGSIMNSAWQTSINKVKKDKQ